MKNIRLDVSGNNDMTSRPWEEGWDAIHALAEAIDPAHPVLSDDSAISGRLRVSVACKSEVKRVNERFGGVVVTDDNVQQFEDREVCRVLNAPTKSSFSAMTTLGNAFQGNTAIKTFNELSDSGVRSLGATDFRGSTIEEIDVSKITSITGSNYSGPFGNTNVKHLLFLSLTKVTGIYGALNSLKAVVYIPKITNVDFPSTKTTLALFAPAATSLSSFTCWGGGKFRLIDLGKAMTSTTAGSNWDGGSISNLVIRKESVVPLSDTGGAIGSATFFVPSSVVSAYQAADNWKTYSSKIKGIGSTEWQSSMRTLASQYAAEYANWTPDQIATADYSDPYIDYRIFGVEPPTE